MLRDMSLDDLREMNHMIVEEIKQRSRREGARLMGELRRGDLIAFNSNVRPTYLRSATARVVSLRQTRLEVELTDGPIGKFRSGTIITSPSLVHKIAGPRTTAEVTP